MDKIVSILIPTRFSNKWPLELTLETIRKYTDCPYKVIVGDAGVDKEEADFLESQKDIQVVKCPDPERPKDYLARIVETPYFIFLHDDVQILKNGWLERRLKMMQSGHEVGIVGLISYNFVYGWKKLLSISPLDKRFFPLGMLIRKQTQDDLDLHWGLQNGFDTGAIAYLQFLKQRKWEFRKCKFDHDIKHWGGLTWVMKPKHHQHNTLQQSSSLNITKHILQREKKIRMIKNLLTTRNY